MTIDQAVKSFAVFLDKSWETVAPLLTDRKYTQDEGAIGDRLQANWELLIEKKVLPVNQHLEIYSSGADYYGASSRITDTKARPDFFVAIDSFGTAPDLLSGEEIYLSGLIFDELVGFENGYYVSKPPFKYALVHSETGDEYVLSIESITFVLKPC